MKDDESGWMESVVCCLHLEGMFDDDWKMSRRGGEGNG